MTSLRPAATQLGTFAAGDSTPSPPSGKGRYLREADGSFRGEAAVADCGRGRLKKAVIRPVKAAECRGDLLTEVEPRAGVAPDHFRPEFAFRHFEKRFAGTMQWHEIIGANLLQG
jgi:hypothetical protein